MQTYPNTRLRRTRQADWSRRLVAESQLSVDDLIWPVFIVENVEDAVPVDALPGVQRYTLAELKMQATRAWQLGIPAMAIFPKIDPAKKCEEGVEATNPENLVCQAIKTIKDAVPQMGVICDVALDPFTSHGQDGVLREGKVHNDDTIDMLCKQALVQARAGCDVVAPSDMMDGRIGAIRAAFEGEGFHDTLILSYAVKYASAFYGPFRDAVGSSLALGAADKRSYQMNPANSDEALREVEMDIAEGADMLMVKPGMPYLDILRRVHERFEMPVLAYQVSGEYAMLKHAAAAGAFDEEAVVMESLLAFKRAGACAIFTYAACEVAEWLS